MFSNLSEGSTIHILKLTDGKKYYLGTVQKVYNNRPLYPTYTANVATGLNMGSVLDIVVMVDGKRKEFTGVNANSSVSTSSEYIITETKEAMISQVDNIMQNSKYALDNMDNYKKDVEECENILKKINPTFAKESAMDKAIFTLTERVNTIQDEFGSVKDDVKQVLSLLKEKQ